jgi:hypothetical protein
MELTRFGTFEFKYVLVALGKGALDTGTMVVEIPNFFSIVSKYYFKNSMLRLNQGL